MKNPFMSYSPLENQASWVGGAEAFTALSDNILHRNNVCILGARGSGKTSLLQCFFNTDYIRKMARERKTIICKVDLSIQDDGNDICQYLADRIKSTTRRILRGTENYQELVDGLNGEEPATPKAYLQNIIDLLVEYGYYAVLVMDRFERFTSSPSITMTHHETLRSLIEANRLRCIVATDYDLSQDSLPQWVKGSYLMQKFTANILLSSMTAEEAMLYVQQQQKDCELKLPEKLILKLIEFSGGVPLLLEYAAECAYDNIIKNGGTVNGRELTASIYERSKPIIKSWCSVLTPTQIKVLKMLTNGSSNNEYQLYDFTSVDQELETAVAALCSRGLLVAPDMEYKNEVRTNSLLFQRYCKEELIEPVDEIQKIMVPVLEKLCESRGKVDSVGGITINIENFNGKVYQDNAMDHSSNLTVQNMQLNQGLSTSDLLQLLCGNENLPAGDDIDSRGVFAAQLSAQLRKFIPDGTTPLLPDVKPRTKEFEQKYDIEFDKISQKLVCDVDVDEEEDLTVTPAELKTLEMRFAEARTRCRTNLTDEILSSQSERCQFYIMLSVVVEDALELPGIQMDDYSPQLVLYGKALEQSLRDNFYDLFHREERLSIFSTYTQSENKYSPDVFANKPVNQTLIGNYTYLISAKMGYLASLCLEQKIQTFDQPSDIDSWTNWWGQLQCDIFEARSIRNLADHADAKLSPNRDNLDLMCDLLFGNSISAGVLSRTLVGKTLYQQLFPPAIPFEVIQTLVGNTCHIICKTVKPNGGIKGVTCEGGYTVNISPKRVQAYRDSHACARVDFVGMELIVLVLECKTQDNREFFGAEIVDICSS